MLTNPMTITETPGGKVSFDIISKLLDERIVLVTGEVNDDMSAIVMAELLYLDAKDPNADISMYINSPGGSVSAGLAIIDTMNSVHAPVCTVACGMAASMGAMILLSGQKGKRMAMPHSEVMIHQPLGGAQGQASDILIASDHILKTRDTLYKMIAGASGKTVEQVAKDAERDNYMSAEEAKAYGLVDSVIA